MPTPVIESETTELEVWLAHHELDRYASVMREHDIGVDVLSLLTDADLAELGLSMGDRRRFQRAINAHVPAVNDSAQPPAHAERRHLTVMFCDLVGSTSLSAKLDPEEYREILVAYHQAAAAPLSQYDGYISRYMGDGLLIYFGYPSAHEDDAERAVRAGLEVIEAVSALTIQRDHRLAVRIGIASGLVVAGDIVGEGASELRAVLGETPNLAARLQALASPNALVISPATRRLIGERFDLASLGTHDLKGIPNAVEAFAVTGVRNPSTATFGSESLPPLIGRATEVERLLDEWAKACAGDGGTFQLNGEAGIGKTRLVQEFIQRANASKILRFQCSSFHTNTPFHPLIQHTERIVKRWANDDPNNPDDKVAPQYPYRAIAQLLGWRAEPESDGAITPERRKAELFDAFVRLLVPDGNAEPVLAIIEDIHWADPSTLEVLTRASAQNHHRAILLVVTYRPEFTPPSQPDSPNRRLRLERLAPRDGAALALQVAARSSLSRALLRRIVDKTDGVPLYVEELTKAILEGNRVERADDESCMVIPESLHDSLMARLDRMAEVKEVAQIGACIGREFSTALLARLTRLDESALTAALVKLVQQELIHPTGEQDDVYAFKHALVQDAAYESLLIARRQHLHRRIAEALEHHFADTIADQPELLAHHLASGGETEAAARCFLQAARLGFERSNKSEAIAHLDRGIALTKEIEPQDAAIEIELELQSTRAHVLANARGYGSNEVRDAYERALALCSKDAQAACWLPVLGGLASYHWTRANVPRAIAYMRERCTLAERTRDPNFRMVAAGTMATLKAYAGELDRALALFESAADLSRDATRTDLHVQFGTDPLTRNLAWQSWATSLAGAHPNPLATAAKAINRAEAIQHPASLGQARAIATLAAAVCEDYEMAGFWGEQCIEYGEEQRLVFWGPIGLVGRAAALAGRGRSANAAAELQQLLDRIEAVGGAGGYGWIMVLAAEHYIDANQLMRAEQLLRAALKLLRRSGERIWTGELLRVSAALARHRNDMPRALTLYDRAAKVSRRLGAMRLAARATRERATPPVAV
ncbi:MAG: adenylate/guanylate cyclase domain-containing protein [Pseudomonadota bacterium]